VTETITKKHVLGNLKRGLTLRFGMLLFLFVVLLVTSYIVTRSAIAAKKFDSVLLNIVGRQRMVMERYAHSIDQVLNAQSRQDTENAVEQLDLAEGAVALFERTHRAFSNGGSTLLTIGEKETIEIPRVETPIIREHLLHVRDEWKELKRCASLALQSEIGAIEGDRFAHLLQIQTSDAVRQMDHVVALLQKESEARLDRVKTYQSLMTGSGIFLFMVILAFVHSRIVVPLDESARALVLTKVRAEAIGERHRAITENTRDAIITTDKANSIRSWNPSAATLFGYSAHEAIGKNMLNLIVPQRSRALMREGMGALDRNGQVEMVGGTRELSVMRKDGTVFPSEFSVTSYKEGQVTISMAVIRDITERKQAEDLSRERQAELAHLARLSTMGEIATGLAHELNQPLCAIVNHVQACLERIQAGQTASDELLDDMTYSAEQAVRAGEIIDRLRHFVSPKRQQVTVAVNDLVHEVADLMRPELSQCGVELHLDLDKALPSLETDAVQVQQVMVNLIKNGIEAMTEAGTDRRYITIRTSMNREGQIECAVRDTGPGLCEGGPDRVFEAFFSTKSNGMGMGLPISRRIIESHGGRLWATSNGARGATFSIHVADHI